MRRGCLTVGALALALMGCQDELVQYEETTAGSVGGRSGGTGRRTDATPTAAGGSGGSGGYVILRGGSGGSSGPTSYYWDCDEITTATVTARVQAAQETDEVPVGLEPLADCDDPTEALEQEIIATMSEYLDRARDAYIYNSCTGWVDPVYVDDGPYGESRHLRTMTIDGGGPSFSAPPSAGATLVSQTNVQVQGVDEADLVKNDNEYVYTVAGGTLRIIDAWPAEEAHQIAQVQVEGQPHRLFVHADRLLVYSSVPSQHVDYYYYAPDSFCTYGYDCDFTGDGNATRLSLYDISDRSNPALVRTLEHTGSYLTSRRIDSAVHTVIYNRAPFIPGVQYYVYGSHTDPNEAWVAFEDLREQNIQAIQGSTDYALPSLVDSRYTDGGPPYTRTLTATCNQLRCGTKTPTQGYISILSLDLNDDEHLSQEIVLSGPGAAYGSSQALYISVPHQQGNGYWYAGMGSAEQASTVHRFELDGATSSYAASGIVKGRVLNQFSMDEYEDHLRIATTSGRVPNPDVHSTLTVLNQQGKQLVKTGIVDNLAPAEDIRSVRFDAARGFIVTFKKTDPLFVLDLSNPQAPSVLAELKIPGFSTYMHMMGENHLLTIGYDAEDQDTFAYFQGVMLQIFDVTDMTDPGLLHREIIGTRGSSSEALNDHLAFNYFAPLDLLSLPMTICEDASGGGDFGDVMTFSGLLVYDTTIATGFNLHGRVEHLPESGDYQDASCSNWWTNASSVVKRSIIMDSYVLSLSETRLKFNHLDDLSTDLVILPLVNPPQQ